MHKTSSKSFQLKHRNMVVYRKNRLERMRKIAATYIANMRIEAAYAIAMSIAVFFSSRNSASVFT